MSKKKKRLTKKQKVSKLTKFLLICIIIVLLYTLFEFILSITTGTSHDTLTTCVYAFFGTELASCTVIKIFNILNVEGKKKNEETEEDVL